MPLDDDAKKRLNETIHRLQDVVDDTVHEAQATGQVARRQIREHPAAAIGVAVGAGLLIGLFLGRLGS